MLADSEFGVYTADHVLTDDSVGRIWKMQRRGLVRFDRAQDQTLWRNFCRHLKSDEAGEVVSIDYRICQCLARDLVSPQASTNERKGALALGVNATLSLADCGMPRHQAAVARQLHHLVAGLLRRADLPEATTALIEALQTPEGRRAVRLACGVVAEVDGAFAWAKKGHVYRVTRPSRGDPACRRVFVPKLGAYLIMPYDAATAHSPPAKCCDDAHVASVRLKGGIALHAAV